MAAKRKKKKRNVNRLTKPRKVGDHLLLFFSLGLPAWSAREREVFTDKKSIATIYVILINHIFISCVFDKKLICGGGVGGGTIIPWPGSITIMN